MSEFREPARGSEELRLIEAIGELPSERPAPAYRARIGREFATGSLKSAVRQRPFLASAALWGSVAAAAVLVAGAFALNQGPDWRVIGVSGEGAVVVNGTSLPLRSPELARAIRRGAHVVLPAGVTLDLVAPGQIAANLAGGTDAVLPTAPNRWWSREVRGRVTQGSAFLVTGRGFHGARLAMDTPEATAHVVGTSLAVLRDAEAGTCVCVLEGKVNVSYEDGKETLAVPAGRRCICPIEGEAEIGPILHSSEHALHLLGEKSLAALGR